MLTDLEVLAIRLPRGLGSTSGDPHVREARHAF